MTGALAGRGGLPLGRVAGVPVRLAPSWWPGALILTVLHVPVVAAVLPDAGRGAVVVLSTTLAVLLAASVLVHELGHVVVARRLGIRVRRVRLHLLGGSTELARRPAAPREEGAVALAGPALSLAVAAVAGLAWWALEPGTAWLLAAELAVANAAVAAFNLLPGLPLDGGRVLRAAVWAATGRRRTGTTAAVAGAAVVAVGLLLWAVDGLVDGDDGAWLRLAVCVVVGWFVVAGAGAEAAGERDDWPPGLEVGALVRPVLQLPAESPVAHALVAAAGRGVVLVRPDGAPAGLLDHGAAARLAASSPGSPAERAAEPLRERSVLRAGESGPDLLDRLRGGPRQLLVLDARGRPAGVLHVDELRRALAAHG